MAHVPSAREATLPVPFSGAAAAYMIRPGSSPGQQWMNHPDRQLKY
jgi:hypothetical protein